MLFKKCTVSCPGPDTQPKGPPVYLSPIGTAVFSLWITYVSEASKLYAPVSDFPFLLQILPTFFCRVFSLISATIRLM